MGKRIDLSHEFTGFEGWENFPSLDTLHVSGFESTEEAKNAAALVKDLIVRFCVNNGIPLISLEISVLDERQISGNTQQFVTHFFVHDDFRFVITPRKRLRKDRLAIRNSPYADAMESMLKGDKINGVRAEPILFHSELREPELVYAQGGPVSELTKQGEWHRKAFLLSTDRYNTQSISEPFESTPRTSANATLATQVDNFMQFLFCNVENLSVSERFAESSRVKSILHELKHATMLVFPFLRDSQRIVGQDRKLLDVSSYGESTSGLVFFAMVAAPLNKNPSIEECERNIKLLADFLLKLTYIFSLKEKSLAISFIQRQSAALEDVAHDLGNILSELHLEPFLKNLFDFSKPLEQALRVNLSYKPPLDEKFDEKELETIATEFYSNYLTEYGRIKTQLHLLEIAKGPAVLKRKHQSQEPYKLRQIISSIDKRLMQSQFRDLNKHFITMRFAPSRNTYSEEIGNDVVFPNGYIAEEMLTEELTELLLNAKKFGVIERNEGVEIIIVVSSKKIGDHNRVRVRVSNAVAPNKSSGSRKSSTLSMIPGIRISSGEEVNGYYRVDFDLGSIEVDIGDGKSGSVAPNIVWADTAQLG